MLSDTARKVLRMLDAHKYVPSIKELARKAGRRELQIRAALLELHGKDHVDYDPDDHYALKVVLAWEIPEDKRSDPRLPKVRHELWESF